jgi:hypothetical protein
MWSVESIYLLLQHSGKGQVIAYGIPKRHT